MPGDMTAIFAADVALAEAQAKLAKIGQWLPVDGHPDLPLGRLVEGDSSSPLRLGYGAWRDLLLGVQFTNGSDQLISAGGITMKNVAGYDLTKFMVGQHGVFGRIVTLATRTYRRPAGAIHAVFPWHGLPAQGVGAPPDQSPSEGKASPHPGLLPMGAGGITHGLEARAIGDGPGDIFPRLLPTSLRPQWSILTAGQLLLGYVGNEAALDYYERELAAIKSESFARQTIEADMELRSGIWSGVNLEIRLPVELVRVSLAPSRLAAFIGALQPAHFAADPAFGVIRLFDTPIDRVTPLLPSFAARAAAFDGRRLINYNVSPEEQDLLRRLKTAFDPDGRLTALEFA
jgi:FAD/FMN-containing dehydrogenase